MCVAVGYSSATRQCAYAKYKDRHGRKREHDRRYLPAPVFLPADGDFFCSFCFCCAKSRTGLQSESISAKLLRRNGGKTKCREIVDHSQKSVPGLGLCH